MENDDLTGDYSEYAGNVTRSSGVREVEDWLKANENQGISSMPIASPVYNKADVKEHQLPEAKPARRESDTSTGRPKSEGSTVGSVMRSTGEVGKQAVGGAIDAIHNAFSVINPLGDWLNDHVADLRFDDNVAPPKTTAGAVTRKLSEFLTGFIPATKLFKSIGVANAAARGVASGALADFMVREPHEGRLADLWKEMKLPQNVLTDYLSSKPDDSELEARFKNAVESAGLGAATEGVLLAARALRAARAVKDVKSQEIDYLRAKYGEVEDLALGVTKDPIVSVAEGGARPADSVARAARREELQVMEANRSALEASGDKKGAAAIAKQIRDAEQELKGVDPRALVRAQKGQPLPEDWGVYINFNRIDEPNQIKFAMGKMAEAMKGNIDEAKRGVITQKETQAMAEDLGMTVQDLLSRRKGQPFNAEEALAARNLWAASAENLVGLAKIAAGKNAGPIDQFNFRRAMALHSSIQAEVLGARAESARGLASWAIPSGSSIEKARAIDQMIQAMGGPQESAQMARRLAILADSGVPPSVIAKFAEKGWGATAADAIKEVWVNGLLSAPTSHVVNVSSNSLVALQSIYERAAAGVFRQVIGGDGVRMGEAAAMTYGMMESIRDAFRMSAQAIRTGDTGAALSKVDLPTVNAISADAFRMSRETGMGRFVDFIGNAARIPSRLLGAEDEFFKTIGYRMELRAQAFRQASSEGLEGPGFVSRVQQIVDNPPDFIKINAADSALYATFTNETGWFGKAIMNLRNSGGSMNPAYFVLPFVRTPVNIARYAFERSPFAPLVGQWRADIAAGGARADLALARMSTGSAIMMMAMDYADSGQISGEGPRDKDKDTREALLRQGWQPYSVKVGDRWYSYNRLDPFGMALGFASNIAESVRKGEIDQDDVDEWQEVTAMSIAAVSQTVVSKTYLEGFAKFIEMMTDPKRYTQSEVQDLIASFTPMTSLNNSVKNMVDPIQREVGSPIDAVQARIAGLSDKLPPRRDLWGRPITFESGMGRFYDFMSPVRSKPEEAQPIDTEIVRIGGGPQRIEKKSAFDGVQANMRYYPKVYDDYTRLAGNDLKHPAWGMGAMDFLNSTVSGKSPMSPVYAIMSDQSRRDFILSTVSEYRRLAQREILQNPQHRQFADEIKRMQDISRNYKMPVLGEQ